MDSIHMHNQSCLASTVRTKQGNAFSAFNAQVYAKERLVTIGVGKS
jgi:hypothetical protein